MVSEGSTKVSGDKTAWKHEGLSNAQTWRYKIRAENAVCGPDSTEWSDAADFVTGQPPEKPSEPGVCIENDPDSPDFDANKPACKAPTVRRLRGGNGGVAATDAPKIVIYWDKGSDEDNIREYEVKILNGEGEFVKHPECDVASAQTLDDPRCGLTMSSFWSGDFQMDQGTYITASIKAKNDKGWSDASRWNTDGAMVQKVPSMMNPPEGSRDLAGNDVTLNWNQVIAPRNGGADVITYVLEYNLDLDTDWETKFGGENQATVPVGTTTYTHTNAGSEKLYYRIAAKNMWGTGPFSRPNLEVDVAKAPDQISRVTVNDAGMVRITWVDPEEGGGSVVSRYEVEIRHQDG